MATGTDGPLPGPNPVLVDVIADEAPGKALDLRCGQGGDAFWLAQRGWAVTSVDVSSTALGRVAARASQVGLRERVFTEKHDPSATFPEGGFDLVNAQYLHSPVEMDRAAKSAPCRGRGAAGERSSTHRRPRASAAAEPAGW